MGLDSYFTFAGAEETWPKVDLKVNLCGGMFSGGDDGLSFRGKVYDDIVEQTSGGKLTLYVEDQDNEMVQEIADALEAGLKSAPDRQVWGEYECARAQVEDLAKAFRVYGDAGYSLVGWW